MLFNSQIFIFLFLPGVFFGFYFLDMRTSNSLCAPNKQLFLVFGLFLNLSLLGCYKYANFFVDSLNAIGSYDFYITAIALPLAISFFTFQQVAYLIDAYRGEAYVCWPGKRV